ncbi:MAG: hypothetical protein C4523_03070 [Myxococcales bacterium]|nr:MAG: hypothetical protein C4523_03070 [Myxococcales bacterium]
MIISSHLHDVRCVTESAEHLSTEAIETGIWQAIVLKDDPFLLLFEKPGDRSTNALIASEICFLKKRYRVQFIGKLANHISHGADFFYVVWMAGPWAVASHIESDGSRLLYTVHYLSGKIRTPKHYQQDGGYLRRPGFPTVSHLCPHIAVIREEL